jgi:16S rRNA (guanine966-N2)-methyltransferase
MDFDGIRVLDLYAGSGALGLEALSRGASHALLVESDRKAATVVRGNIADLGLPGGELRVGTVSSVLASTPPEPYDLVLSDPPYAVDAAQITADLTALTANGWLCPDALVVVERATRSPETSWPTGFSPHRIRRYGETRIESADYEP